jgi:CHAT domain-containing protein/Tfp pilus assembly protein PilF
LADAGTSRNATWRELETNDSDSDLENGLIPIKLLTMLLLAAVLLGPVDVVRAQGPEKRVIASQEDLFYALIDAESVGALPAHLEMLCQQNRDFLTPELGLWLRNRAAMITGGNAAQAIRCYRTAHGVARALQDNSMMGSIELALGRKHLELWQITEAIEVLVESRAHFNKAGLGQDELFALSQLARAYQLQRDFNAAKLNAERSIELANELRDQPDEKHIWPVEFGEAISESVLGFINARNQRYADAIVRFERALELFEGLRPRLPIYEHYITDTLDSLGDAYAQTGEFGWALVHLERALAMARNNSLPELEVGVLDRLGVLYLKREDVERAEDYFRKCLQLAKALGNESAIARAELELGISAVRRNQDEQAVAHFHKCLEISTTPTDTDILILAHSHLASIYLARGDLVASLQETTVCDQLLGNDPLRTAETMLLKADIYRRLGNIKEAIDEATGANTIALQHNLERVSYFAHLSMAESYSALDRVDQAEDELHRALEILEKLRAHMPGDFHHRQAFFGRSVSAYHILIDLLQKEGRLTEALTYAERARARALLDRLYSIRTDDAAVLTEIETSEQRRLSSELVLRNRELRAARARARPEQEVREIATKLREKRTEYATFREILQTLHPELQVTRAVPPSLDNSDLLTILPDRQSALLQFVVTEAKVILFVARRDPRDDSLDLRVYPTTFARADLERQVTRFHWLMSNRHPSFRSESRALYDLLIKPAEKDLAGTTQWCIIPDDMLWKVPFQALESPGVRYLIEGVSISYAPSIAFLLESSRRPMKSSGGLLALGDPRQNAGDWQSQLYEPLPEAALEVRTVASRFGRANSVVLVGSLASEAAFKAKAGNSRVIHLATHGVLDSSNPLYSFLVLADGDGEDGMLETREVLEMDLRADLVVLSACDSGQGLIGGGEGVIGITWAFLAAGARAAVVSQWAVKSGTSSRQMISFYNQLKPSISRSESLRQSALEMLRGSQFNHPFYWACFVVIGNDR